MFRYSFSTWKTEDETKATLYKWYGLECQAKGAHNHKRIYRKTYKYANGNSHIAQKNKTIHKCQSQLSISLRTGGTLPPHHLRVLFITVWQHVSLSPRHYAALIFTNCAAAWDTTQPWQKYDTGWKYFLHLLTYIYTHVHAVTYTEVSACTPILPSTG